MHLMCRYVCMLVYVQYAHVCMQANEIFTYKNQSNLQQKNPDMERPQIRWQHVQEDLQMHVHQRRSLTPRHLPVPSSKQPITRCSLTWKWKGSASVKQRVRDKQTSFLNKQII